MSHNALHGQWLRKCRSILIEMETKNIRQRALSWTEIVNTETTKINGMLAINLSNYRNDGCLFKYCINTPLKYLNFLSEWNGIKTRNISTQPSSYNEFEQKAKNWLNGRRAPNYGNTLFPEMIKASYTYSNQLSILIFGNIPLNKQSITHHGDSLQNLYHKTLLFAYLSKLCSERIAVHQSWKKTNLLCENSVKNMHSNTAKLLQKYAIHDYTQNDLNSFPGNLQRSAAFFEEQHSQYLARLMRAYNAFNNRNNRSNRNSNNYSMSYPEAPSIIGDSRAGLNVKYVAIKSSEYATIMERLTALEQKHDDQANQITTLTAKCQVLQTQIEANTIASSSGVLVNHFDKLRTNDMNDEYYNDHSLQSTECSIPSIYHPSITNKTTSSLSSISHDTRSTYSNNHIPMPFGPPPSNIQHSTSLPPQIEIPSFTSSSVIVSDIPTHESRPNDNTNDRDRKLDVSYGPSGSTHSVPMTNNNNNYNTYNYSEYGLELPQTFTNDHMMSQNDDFTSSFTPNSKTFMDHIMLDHTTPTYTNTELFKYPTLP